MSSSEWERLARIRMQVTGETLQCALAALQGHRDPAHEDAPAPEQLPSDDLPAREARPDGPRSNGVRPVDGDRPQAPVLRICPDPAAGS